MSLSVTLPDALAASLAAEAARRDLTPDELAAEFIAASLPGSRPKQAGHRLRFAAIGGSTSGRSAAEDEEMLAEGVRSLSLLVDTNVLLAYADANDPDHSRCLTLLEGEPAALTPTAMVVAETGWLIARQLGALAEAEFYRSVLAGELEVEPLGLDGCAELTEKYADSDLGGVDSSLIAVAERLRVNTIATLDHRHFRAVRPNHVGAFKLVPYSALSRSPTPESCPSLFRRWAREPVTDVAG